MDFLLEPINSESAPKPIGPYSQAIKVARFVFLSGQIALDASTGVMKNASVEEETRQVLQNIEAILTQAGVGFAHVVKTTIFLTSMDDFALVNRVYEELIGSARPTRSTVAVSGLPKGARVEIECIAFTG